MDTILTKVLEHATRAPERLAFEAISRRKGTSTRTFAELARDAGLAAAGLAAEGVRRGDVVVYVGTHHPDLHAAWLGAVWLGAVPTILAEPSVRIDRGIYFGRLRALLTRIGARLLLADPSITASGAEWPVAVAHRTYSEVIQAGATPPPVADVAPGDLLLLQHSSGTTGLQKGVMLSHGAVMRHGEAYQEALRLREGDLIASWLPLYHDMGMIGCFVMPLIYGTPVAWLSPFEWVANPTLLLEVITQRRATVTWLPNFAYCFITDRARQAPGTFDLSSLRAVINCSEPVTPAAHDVFSRRFAADGLAPAALQACYAMAENIFAVTTTTERDPPRVCSVSATAWRERHVAERAESGGLSPAIELISSGVAVPGCEIEIRGEDGQVLPPLHAGRILIRSGFLFDGYFSDPREDLFDREGWYDTGDLGFMDAEGHLFVTGRKKDLVIIGGKNVYPQDVEQVVGAVEGVYPGRVVCFGAEVRGLGTEGLVVLVESELDETEWPDLCRRIQRAVPASLDLDLTEARVVPRGALRKSTSGKLAREGNREWYLAGEFGQVSPKLSGGSSS